MEKSYIACDPGAKGFITIMRPNCINSYIAFSEHTLSEIYTAILEHVEECERMMWKPVGIIEEVHAIFGSSAKATFSFGEIYGSIKAFFMAAGIPLHLVQPKKWQLEIWTNSDKVFMYKPDKTGKVKKIVDTKKTSINAAMRIFPGVDLRRTKKCKNVDDNKCDSLLIAEYARRRNL